MVTRILMLLVAYCGVAAGLTTTFRRVRQPLYEEAPHSHRPTLVLLLLPSFFECFNSEPQPSRTTPFPIVGRAGGPTFLKLHHAAVLQRENENCFTYMDFLPEHPRDPMVLAQLLAGQSVEGHLR